MAAAMSSLSAETERQFEANRAPIPVRGGPGKGAGHLCHFLLLHYNTQGKIWSPVKAGESLVWDREAVISFLVFLPLVPRYYPLE